MNLLKIFAENVYCIGDIHGHFEGIGYAIKTYDLKNSLLIFCGDIGFGFEKPMFYQNTFDKLSKICKKYNTYCIFFRGNHDDPSYFDGVRINRKWIKAVPDYTVIQTFLADDTMMERPNKTFLLVGGGTSIDRKYRQKQEQYLNYKYASFHNLNYADAVLANPVHYYWSDEAPVYDEGKLNEIKDNGIQIEYVCTHSSPDFCAPRDKNGIKEWMEYDENLEQDVTHEREVMTLLFNKVNEDGHPLKSWYNGHFHKSGFETLGDVNFYHLDMERNKLDMIEVY